MQWLGDRGSCVYVFLLLIALPELAQGRRFPFGKGTEKVTRPTATFHSFSPTRLSATAEATVEAPTTPTALETTEATPLSVPDGAIQVSASVELPFPRAVAYDAFADLSRQSTYSPWLQSVEYVNGKRNVVGALTRWKLSYLGLRFSWNAICTVVDPQNGIVEWKSISGLSNQGRVVFSEHPAEDGGRSSSIMHMTMCVSMPRIAARLVGQGQLASLFEKHILENTIQNFRHIVAENDWKRIQEQAAEAALLP
jgi:uncharacterized membrane protein